MGKYMGNTKIEWADKVWNPATGCTPVSEGCDNCYARRMHERRLWSNEPFSKVTLHLERFEEPLHWHKPRRIFVCSMGDLFHEAVPDEFISHVFAVIWDTPRHTYLILTKRRERMQRLLGSTQFWRSVRGWLKGNLKHCYRDLAIRDTVETLPNVWLGVSCEDQKTADERIPLLLQTPAAIRFVSIEPMLGPVDLNKLPNLPPCSSECPRFARDCHETERWICAQQQQLSNHKLDLVIVGGETGPKARPMHPGWVRSVRDQCQAAHVPFFFKQWGEWILRTKRGMMNTGYGVLAPDGTWHSGQTGWNGRDIDPDTGEAFMIRVGKKVAGQLLDGREWSEFPKEK